MSEKSGERSHHKPRRNAAGQFVKGSSGNPKGRPKKRPVLSDADTLVLANKVVNVKIDGKMREMTRRELNHLRLFEAANRGDVRAQIYLDRKFEKLDESRAEIIARLERYEEEFLYGPEAADAGVLPTGVRIWMERAYRLLGRTPLWEAIVPKDDPELLEIARKNPRELELYYGEPGSEDESDDPETPESGAEEF